MIAVTRDLSSHDFGVWQNIARAESKIRRGAAGVIGYVRRRFARMYCFREIAPLPRAIHLEITWDCNLNCYMCPRSRAQPERLRGRNLSREHFHRVISKIPSLKHLNLIGAGEPLVHPDFYLFCEIANSRGITVSLTTNGMLLSPENIAKLPENVRAIHFSIDETDPERYRRIRKGGDLSLVLDNMAHLRELRSDITIVIQALMFEHNLEDLHELVDIAKNVNASLHLLHPIAFDADADRESVHYLGAQYEEFVGRISKKAKEARVPLLTRPATPRRTFCDEPWLHPLVSINGDIYPCCYIYEGRAGATRFREYYLGEYIDVPMHQYVLGNILKDDFPSVWNGSEFRSLRRLAMEANRQNDLSAESLERWRRDINLERKYSYCHVCLYKWMCAC